MPQQCPACANCSASAACVGLKSCVCSGLVDAARYNETILESMGAIKVCCRPALPAAAAMPTSSLTNPCSGLLRTLRKLTVHAVQARSFVTDIFMGTSNPNASFRDVIGGPLNSAAANGETYDFELLDSLVTGLGEQLVSPCLWPRSGSMTRWWGLRGQQSSRALASSMLLSSGSCHRHGRVSVARLQRGNVPPP